MLGVLCVFWSRVWLVVGVIMARGTGKGTHRGTGREARDRMVWSTARVMVSSSSSSMVCVRVRLVEGAFLTSGKHGHRHG